MKYLCPLSNNICPEDGCGWWIAEDRMCAIKSIALDLSVSAGTNCGNLGLGED
jgi:hypothetical protein